MGICLDVHSIVYWPPETPMVPHSLDAARWYAESWQLVVLIAEAMGWRTLPWDEPSDYHSADSFCCNKSKYDLLRAVACAAATDLRFTTPAQAWIVYDAHHTLPHYQHLISRKDSGYIALYVPSAVETPITIASTSSWETFTVGSAAQLKADADALEAVIHQYAEERGGETMVEREAYPGKAPHTWNDLGELCQQLSDYAREGLEHRVPMFIAW